jgi:hypothetical protein
MKSETTNRMRKSAKSTHAMFAETPETTPIPKKPAMIAMMRKVIAQDNMVLAPFYVH